MKQIYDFYLAGPFFNDEQVNMQEKIEDMFKLHSKKCFSPRLDAGTLSENATKKDMYDVNDDHIDILFKDGSIKDIAEASEILNIQLLSKKICKYYLCYQRI